MHIKFFSIEGIDGSGKGTIVKYIANYLNRRLIPFTCVASFPDDEDSMRLRKLWIGQHLPPLAILSVILELRRRVVVQQIIPALLNGHVVITDRFNDSTIAYQQYGQGIPSLLLQEAFEHQLDFYQILADYRHGDNHVFGGQPLTDQQKDYLLHQLERYKTIHLDITVQTSRERMKGRDLDAFERKPDEFFWTLINGFKRVYAQRSQAQGQPIIVNANLPLDEVTVAIGKIIDEHIVGETPLRH